jgi:predicted O-methyltransferase YrrM
MALPGLRFWSRRTPAAPDYFEALAHLKRIYAERDIEISVGVNSYLCSNLRSAAFALYHQNGQLLTPHSGIGYDELLLIGKVANTISAKRIFIVGNGMGWSTIGLAILCPRARVVAIEPEAGIDLTNDIAREHGFDAQVVQGRSPENTQKPIEDGLGALPDLILVDALHDEASLSADFRTLYGLCGSRPVYVVHDVLTFGLADVMKRLHGEIAGMDVQIAGATSSGLGFMIPHHHRGAVDPLISLFRLSPSATETLRRIGRERAMPPVDLLRYGGP